MAESSNIIFEDRFTVETVDKDGKKFDRVSRITAPSHNLQMSLTLDLANELYPLDVGEVFTLAIARTLVPDELNTAEDEDEEGNDGQSTRKIKRELWRSENMGLGEDYDYVMYGKVSSVPFERSLEDSIPSETGKGGLRGGELG
uniref:DNA-directed RNA polymerases I, II, and III subunit RPABC3 n=1 Tax=Kwoniella bestiolae CBS 10118 TaxID=1296100 RepID=A0A1B9FWD8_9TREE|nr:DNA-directed RNA polymerase I, II, and III subunit RPABC3 [Kwoniella bestiolae CBS 10118]OCF23087.1 DNA-directed RNA polymerase I, II, and III subunit RPABC3 [Kwoniella bestiolae CBS 10118]